ncbi:MAG: hypothetical protein KAQ97_09710 [Candidatus Fermentibacteraceae bacterium]|nr:hypothetical protein [Candidatus Fermentibacteraceae bacterium]
MSRGTGRGQQSITGGGRGRGGGPYAAGPGGNCVCSGCGKKIQHQQGQACNKLTCPVCGMRMTRE